MEKKLRVMVVDDVQLNRQLLMEMIKDKATFDEAENGLEAWNLYKKSIRGGGEKYDLMLLDVAMPEMDGIKLLELIRELEKLEKEKKLPVLVITGHKEKISEVISVGCDDYLLKPVIYDQLILKMNTILGKE